MKKTILSALTFITLIYGASAQDLKARDIPAAVKTALTRKYPNATKISWEKEKGNYEANWGGTSGEDTSVQFTPAGTFAEQVDAIKVSELPPAIAPYVKTHYKGAKIKEAGKVTNAAGQHLFEAEIKGKDLVFDADGKFVKAD
jgi:hypothetical protein